MSADRRSGAVSVLDGNSTTPDTESLVRRVIEIIQGTRTLPLSSSVKLDNKDDVLDLLNEACDHLPEETRQARWMLKEREEFLAKMQREGDDIVQAARLQAERMVQRTEIVREAQATARRLVEDGRGRGSPAAAGGGGLLRPEAGRLRGGSGPDHQDGGGRAGEVVGDPTTGAGRCRRRHRRHRDG